MKTGLVSVTFRQLTPAQIIELCKEAGVDGIEWGTDVHITSPEIAKEVAPLMGELKTLSLGSYYRLGQGQNFASLVASAKILHAPNIRVWAGAKEPQDMTDAQRAECVADAQKIADMAAQEGISISFEYHGGTLTANHQSAIQLLKEIDRENVYIYWQPIYDRGQDAWMSELREICQMGKLKNLHVFTWRNLGAERLPLAADAADWTQRLQAAASYADSAIIEFVVEDKPEAFLADAKWLKGVVDCLK